MLKNIRKTMANKSKTFENINKTRKKKSHKEKIKEYKQHNHLAILSGEYCRCDKCLDDADNGRI